MQLSAANIMQLSNLFSPDGIIIPVRPSTPPFILLSNLLSNTSGLITSKSIGSILSFHFTTHLKLLKSTEVKEAFSSIDVQLKKRYDLIPNLVETVRGAAKHESETLSAVTSARNAAMAANGPTGGDAQNKLTQTLKSLFAVAENYPDLKANQNFMELQRELRDTEDKIQAARRFYNGNVLAYNTKAEMFPSNMVATWFHFEKQEFFELAEDEQAARKAVSVKF